MYVYVNYTLSLCVAIVRCCCCSRNRFLCRVCVHISVVVAVVARTQVLVSLSVWCCTVALCGNVSCRCRCNWMLYTCLSVSWMWRTSCWREICAVRCLEIQFMSAGLCCKDGDQKLWVTFSILIRSLTNCSSGYVGCGTTHLQTGGVWGTNFWNQDLLFIIYFVII